MSRAAVLVLGPSREAVSGVSTHVNALLASKLAASFSLQHFQVGSEGRAESGWGKLARLAASPFQLGAAIARSGALLVHANTSLNARAFWRDFAYVAAAKLSGARVVLQVHGGALRSFAGRSRLAAALTRGAGRAPDVVVVLSRAERDAWQALLPDQAVAVVPNGIDCAAFRRFNRPAHDPQALLRVVYVGRLARGKGLDELLEGLRLAREQGVAARLVLAGTGPEEPRLRRRVREAGLADDVSFAGAAFGEHKARLLSVSDVLALPSYSEGLPYALLEAMAAGVVPLVTPVGAVPDVVEDGVHGALVAPRDAPALARALRRLAADRAALARMSAACRQRVAAEYSLERMAEDFSLLYCSLIPSWAASRAG